MAFKDAFEDLDEKVKRAKEETEEKFEKAKDDLGK